MKMTSMTLLSTLHFVIDIPRKILFYFTLRTKKYSVFTQNQKSDSDSTPYSDFVSSVLADKRNFEKFRRNYSYRLILEHVGFQLGKIYLTKLKPANIDSYLHNQTLLRLSEIGAPRVYKYDGVGWISPTILRYLFVHQNLIKIFKTSEFDKVAEIGVGFGGQICVSLQLMQIESYSIYDLPQVSQLAKRVLKETGIFEVKVQTKSINPLEIEDYDLVISNYAFSELPYSVQNDYVDRILTRAKRGYLTMNSGRTNKSGRSTGKMSLEELLQHLPGAEVLEEDPLTGPDNYILVWGHK